MRLAVQLFCLPLSHKNKSDLLSKTIHFALQLTCLCCFPCCVAAAHCLHTVTEDNPELLCSLNAAVLRVLDSVLLSSQQGMAHTLLRTLAAGTLCHFFLDVSSPTTATSRPLKVTPVLFH